MPTITEMFDRLVQGHGDGEILNWIKTTTPTSVDDDGVCFWSDSSDHEIFYDNKTGSFDVVPNPKKMKMLLDLIGNSAPRT